jgi:hypothetical protein
MNVTDNEIHLVVQVEIIIQIGQILVAEQLRFGIWKLLLPEGNDRTLRRIGNGLQLPKVQRHHLRYRHLAGPDI